MLAAEAIKGPSIHYAGILPMLILFGAASIVAGIQSTASAGY